VVAALLRVFAVAAVVPACSGAHGETADAAPDVVNCPSTTVFTPVAVSGTSPQGSLDVFHFASAGFVTGFCPDAYLITFTPAQLDPSCVTAPWLQLSIPAPFSTTGPNAAGAILPNTNDGTSNVTFEATELDQPDAMVPRIAGHFVSHDPAWSFDIAVDLTSQSFDDCL
jgi:hypothetical protein